MSGTAKMHMAITKETIEKDIILALAEQRYRLNMQAVVTEPIIAAGPPRRAFIHWDLDSRKGEQTHWSCRLRWRSQCWHPNCWQGMAVLGIACQRMLQGPHDCRSQQSKRQMPNATLRNHCSFHHWKDSDDLGIDKNLGCHGLCCKSMPYLCAQEMLPWVHSEVGPPLHSLHFLVVGSPQELPVQAWSCHNAPFSALHILIFGRVEESASESMTYSMTRVNEHLFFISIWCNQSSREAFSKHKCGYLSNASITDSMHRARTLIVWYIGLLHERWFVWNAFCRHTSTSLGKKIYKVPWVRTTHRHAASAPDVWACHQEFCSSHLPSKPLDFVAFFGGHYFLGDLRDQYVRSGDLGGNLAISAKQSVVSIARSLRLCDRVSVADF